MTLPDARSSSQAETATGGVPSVVLWGALLVAAAHVGYLALLICSDFVRITPLPFVPRFDNGAMSVAEVQPDSISYTAALHDGDVVTRANGQVVQGRLDWQRVRVNLDPAVPLDLQIIRTGQALGVRLPLTAESFTSLPVSRPGLVAFRFFQVITLAFALMVAVRRWSQPSALLGAWLLASIAAASLVLPTRSAVFWQALPVPVGWLLLLPAATGAAVGPLLFAFFATFPARLWSRRRLALSLVPGAIVVTWSGYATAVIIRPLGEATGLRDLSALVFAVNVGYCVVAIGMLQMHRRAAQTSTDRRRIQVLSLGAIVGTSGGAALAVGYSQNPGVDIFATRTLTLLSLVFLAVPASFAFAILRQRLFDIRLIVRQGVRYALTKRLLNALIPTLGALLLLDVLLHRSEPLLSTMQSRGWWYSAVVAALLIARFRRERWLEALDRRFFRERYDAQRLLRNIAEQIRRAASFDEIAPLVIRQIDEALHPEFVDVLAQAPDETLFTPITSVSLNRTARPLPSSLTVIGLLSVLRQPLALSLGDTAWVRHQLPLDERAMLGDRGIELLVPIVHQRPGVSGATPVALLVFGPRRSEEPYNEEDLDLLGAIAYELGLLLDRPAESPAPMGLAECDSCGRCFDSSTGVCSHDSQRLTTVRGSRVLNGRYRLDRKIGHGGMGAVYCATDEALERLVAVKLIREDLVGSIDLDARFRREALAAASFAHPNVVRVYDFGVDRDGRPYLVMELLEGQTLRQRLGPHEAMAVPDVLHVLHGVCAAVSAAHRHGLVHRDLKPENIFLQRHETGVLPKVLDFGLAKAFGAPLPISRSRESTGDGLLVGTLEYMAPEQVAGDVVSPAWDIWALGVITHEMLTGRHPFRRSVVFGSDELATGDPGGIAVVPALPDSVMTLLGTALSSQAAARPKDAMDFLHAFERVLA